MIKSKNTAKKQSSISAQMAFMKELVDSPWWKLMEKEIDKVMADIKVNLWLQCTDQSLKYNINNMWSERIVALFLVKMLPKTLISDFEQILAWDKEDSKTLVQKLDENNTKLSKELQKYIKM